MKQSKRKRGTQAESSSPDAHPEGAAAQATADVQHAVAGPGESAATRLFALQPSCTVRDCIPLRTALLDLIDEPLPVTLDLRSVERVDTAAMQVLCAFVRDRRDAGRTVNWMGTPETFAEAVSLLGMSQALGMTLGMPSDAAGAAA